MTRSDFKTKGSKNIDIPGIRRLPADKIEVGTYLGAGAFGDVHQAIYHYRPGCKLPIARKAVIGTKVDLSNAERYEAFEWEVMRLASVSHPNLVHFYGYHQEKGNLFLDMEYCSGGTLENLLKKGRLSLSCCWQIALDLAQGLAYLEHHGIVHRDLKPDNILLDDQGHAKLADLGIAQVDMLVQASEAKSVTTLKAPAWAAPEEILGEASTTASDLYSSGLILWYLVTGKNPTTLPGFVIKELSAQSLEARLSVFEKAMKKETPTDSQAQALYSLIGSLLARNPRERISAETLVSRLYQLSILHPEGGLLQSAQISHLEVEEQRDVLLDYLPLHVVTRPLQEDSDTYWQRWEKSWEKSQDSKSTKDESKERPESKTSEAPQSLEDNFKRFIADQDQPVLVLLGEGGLGKSLSTYQLAQGLLHQMTTDISRAEVRLDKLDKSDVFYGRVGNSQTDSAVFYGRVDQSSSVGKGTTLTFHGVSPSSQFHSPPPRRLPPAHPDAQWLPIFIRPGISTWAHSQLNNGLIVCLKSYYHLDDKAINALKQKKVVFIFDGYDELQNDAAPGNLPTQLGLAAFPNAKLIVTSRLSAIKSGEESRRFGFNGRLTDYYLLPLSITQLLGALEQRLVLSSGEQERYSKQLQEAGSLRTALRNPFVLNLFIQSFTTLSRQGLETLSRVGIYSGFIRHWLTTQQGLIPEDIRRLLQGKNPDLINSFYQLAETLAFDAYQQNVLLLEAKLYTNEKTYPWLHLPTLSRNYSLHEFAKRRAAVTDRGRALLSEDDYIGLMQRKTNYFMTFNPLKQRADGRWNFVHKSFFEYFVAWYLMDSVDHNTLTSVLKYFGYHPIQNELGIVNFFIELLREEPVKEETRQTTLFQLIETSKTKSSAAQSAANAITLLNAANVSFSGRDFAGIRIPGADLSQGVLDTTNLEGADLNRVRIAGAWLRQTNLRRAQMHGVEWSEWPFITVPKSAWACAYSPDGRWLAVGCEDSNIYLYNAQHRTLQHTLKGHTKPVTSIAFDPKGKHLGSGSYDKTVRLWQVATGRLARILEGHTKLVTSVAFDPKGECLASGSDDTTVLLWQVASGRLTRKLEGHVNEVTSVAFDPKGELLASGSHQIVRLWLVATGRLKCTLEGHVNDVTSVAFDPSGERLACGGFQSVKLWQVATGRLERTLEGHMSTVYSVAFDPTGEHLASGSGDNTVCLWQVATGRLEHTLEGHTAYVKSVVFDPKGEHLATASDDKTVRLWQVTKGRMERRIEGHTREVEDVAFDPKGERLASGSSDNTVRLWQVATGRLERTLKAPTPVPNVAFDPKGEHLATASDDKTVRLWKVATGQLERTLEGHTQKVTSVAFDPKGECLASGSDDYTVRLWQVATGRMIRILKGHIGIVNSVAFDSKGEHLVSRGNSTVHLWQVTGRLVRTWGTSISNGVAFDPKGERLASGNGPTVRLWQVATGQLERTFEGHTWFVNSVAFDPKGECLASGSSDQTVRLWQVATGACLTVIGGFTKRVKSVCFQPTLFGLFLATGGDDKAVRYWQVEKAKQDSDKLQVMLRWTSHQSALTVVDACIDGVIGLDSTGRDLLQQRGAKGAPAEVKDHDLDVKSASAPKMTLPSDHTLIPAAKSSDCSSQSQSVVVMPTTQVPVRRSQQVPAVRPGGALPQQQRSPALFQSSARVSGSDSSDLELESVVVQVDDEKTKQNKSPSTTSTAAAHTDFDRKNQRPPTKTVTAPKKICPCVIL